MWFFEEISKGIESGLVGEIAMAHVIMWFFVLVILMIVFFVWEYITKLTDKD